jgi:hypothetical protein
VCVCVGDMELVLENVKGGNEDDILSSLVSFNEQNKTNFNLEEDLSTRETFCSTLLEQLSSRRWLPRTQAAALTSLRIAARENDGVQKLRSEDGLSVLVNLADLSRDIKQSCFHGDTPPPEDRVKGE